MSDIYVRLSRPEGYENVHPDLVVEDAQIDPAFAPLVVTDEIERLRAEKATDAWHTGWQEAVRRMQQAERQLAEAVALLREIAEDGQCPLCDLSDGAHDVGCRLDAFLAGGR